MYHVSRITSFLCNPLIYPVIGIAWWVVGEIDLDLFAIRQLLTDESILYDVNVFTTRKLCQLLKPYRHDITFGYLLRLEFHWIVYTVEIKSRPCLFMGYL